MNRILILLPFLFIFHHSFAETKYPLGEGMESWGVRLKVPDSDLSMKLGARYQSLATLETEDDLDSGKHTTSQDFYSRRVRLQVQVDLSDQASFIMDLRNDNANEKDEGEQKFFVGDAYVFIPLLKDGDSRHDLRAYRAKVDVSRSQTASSAELVFLNRAYVSDESAQYVSHNRRATNVQLIGNFTKKVSYQIVLGDGVYFEEFNDAKGNPVAEIQKQNLMFGGKIRLAPIAGFEEKKITETYLGEGKHFTVGIGAFNLSNIQFVSTNGQSGKTSRNLLNAEVSGHHEEWSFQAEYFRMMGLIEDHGSTTGFKKGSGEGWYAHAEKVFKEIHYLAPFIRYEKWDRFQQRGDYGSESSLFGLNWYLNGNRFKASVAYQIDRRERDITGSKTEDEAFHIATMWHF